MPRWLLVLPLVYVLFFFGLTATGLLGPDEPRYASVGREMARSGDWITPRLWGEPWFEKPALLYWMTGAAFQAGLSEDLAPRLPVALTSVAFLAFYFWILRREFGPRAAWFSTVMLGTSAGWLAYSYAGVTDLPMSAAFAAAMLIALPWLKTGDRRLLPVMGVLLGLAVLAKVLVPLALALPLAWCGRRRIVDLLRPATVAPFLVVAAPWYVLCYLRNGAPFIRTLFWEHHFERFVSTALLHQQPFWFYVPVLLAGFLPWTPLLALLFAKAAYADRRRAFLLLWLVFGFVLFSASVNKLPGYLLPLLPAAAALAGTALAEAKRAHALLASSAVMLILIPVMVQLLPQALAAGLTHSRPPAFSWLWLVPGHSRRWSGACAPPRAPSR